MKKSYLYMLVDADTSAGRFKMGHSTDPYHRQKTLVQKFDLERSLQAPFNRATVHQLEAHLHERYASHQVDPAIVGECEGRNEWFSIACFDDVVSYINSNGITLEPVEKGMHRVIVPIPKDLYRRMKYACIDADIPVQQAIVALIEKMYGEDRLTIS